MRNNPYEGYDDFNDFLCRIYKIDKLSDEIIPIIARRLHEINGKLSYRFWERTSGLFLFYFTGITYEIFTYMQQKSAIKIDKYQLSNLVINDSNDFYEMIRYEIGLDCIAAEYVDEFCGKVYVQPEKADVKNLDTVGSSRKSLLNRLRSVKITNMMPKVLRKIIKPSSVKIGLYGSLGSERNKDAFFMKSKGAIREIDSYIPAFMYKKVVRDSSKRAVLSAPFSTGSMDNYERFFLRCLNRFFPTLLLEQFEAAYEHYSKFLLQFPNLKALVGDAWIGTHRSLFFFSLAAEKGIKFIYAEHNAHLDMMKNSSNWRFIQCADTFITLGWNSSYPNAIKGGSIFEFNIPHKKKNQGIVYVGVAIERRFFLMSSIFYPLTGGQATEAHASFISSFLRHLDASVTQDMKIKALPDYNPEKYFPINYDELAGRKLSYIDSKLSNAKEYISSAKLTIIDYIATTYLETLFSNKPFVLIYSEKIYVVSDYLKPMFDELKNAGIAYTNPVAAANHVNYIYSDVDSWWYSEKVQKSRQYVLDHFLRGPDCLYEILKEFMLTND